MTTTARHPALVEFLLHRAIRRGTFTLTSGRTANYYCDGKAATFSPEGAELIADAILDEIGDLRVDALGGMDMGATPMVAAVALRSHQRGRPLPAFVVRKEAKKHGLQKRFEGLLPAEPARVAIVDDVVTTAGSIIRSIEAVREAGHEVVIALSVLDREQGGREALAEAGVEYRPLVTATELGLS